MAVSAFTGGNLDQWGYYDFEDISINVPNVQFGDNLLGSGGITIRGISSGTGDRATAFHVDGIYINRSSAAEGITFFDLRRVEVLRGPQGTLYGRNATGGSINVVTNPPGPDFEAYGDFQYGTYDQFLWRGALNVPLIQDHLFARVSLFGEKRHGYQENIASRDDSDDADDADNLGIRGQLRFLPTDDLDLTLRYNYSQQKPVGPALKVLGDFPDQVLVGGAFLTDQYCTSAAAQAAGCLVTPNPSDNRKIALDLIGDNDDWDHNANGQLAWELPNLSWIGDTQFKLIGSWLERRQFGLTDLDGSDADLLMGYTTADTSYTRIPDPDPLAPPGSTILVPLKGCDVLAVAGGATPEAAGCTRGHDELTEATIEAQWRSSGLGNLEWVIGAFYLYSRFDANTIVISKPLPWVTSPPAGDTFSALQVPVLTSETTKAQSAAVFGQASYTFGAGSDSIWDDWTPTLGLRYTHDKKTGVQQTPGVSVLGLTVQDEIDTNDSETWGAVTGIARLQWDWSERNMAYFSVSRGYKAGEINTALVDLQDSTSSYPNADPEYIWAYELGSKNRFWGDRLQANLTGFHYDYRDLQVSQLGTISIVTQNAADATVWGFEAELIAEPLEGRVPSLFEQLTLVGNFGYLHAEYDDFENCTLLEQSNAAIDCSGNSLVRAPPYTITLIADWPLDFGRWGVLTPRVQFYASGEVYFRATNCPNSRCAAEGAFNDDSQESYELLDVRLTWTSEKRRISIAGFANNVLDEDVISSQAIGSSQFGSPIQVRFAPPRTAGIRLGLAW